MPFKIIFNIVFCFFFFLECCICSLVCVCTFFGYASMPSYIFSTDFFLSRIQSLSHNLDLAVSVTLASVCSQR